ncbi:hypothetical protein LUZ60_012795 [Juncus effusus]|nr:hypothetical protein LUZ60_012795 [Juncus effusus]
MALSFPSLEFMSPQFHQNSLLEGNCTEIEMSDLYSQTNSPTKFALSLDNFTNFGSSILSFDQEDQPLLSSYHSSSFKEEYGLGFENLDQNYYQFNQLESYMEMPNGFNSIGDGFREDSQFVFSYPLTSHIDYVQESLKQEKASKKRQYEGEEMEVSKKQCGMNRKTKTRATSPPKETQSLAAKNRREKISERLRVLQELVPNGTKVDLVTMLEKAHSYVKFLQLQVKVLSTDEFWPAQGGSAPDVSEVQEAINAILSSQKEKI